MDFLKKYYKLIKDPIHFPFGKEVEEIKINHDKNPKTIVKRSLRFFKWFLKYLDKNNFQYQLIFFIDLFQENFRTTTSIDCTKYYKEYHKSDGDDPNTKIKLQSSIANHVANLIA